MLSRPKLSTLSNLSEFIVSFLKRLIQLLQVWKMYGNIVEVSANQHTECMAIVNTKSSFTLTL